MSTENKQDQTTSEFDGGINDHEYFASTVTCVEVNRSDTTNLRAEPSHVFDIVWNMDLNAFMYKHGITPSYVEDVYENVHETVKDSNGVISNTFYYNVATNDNVVKLAIVKELTNGKVKLTYTDSSTTRTSGDQDTQDIAMDKLSKQLRINDDNTVSLLSANGLQDVGSSMEPVIIASVSSARVNLLANQVGIDNMLDELKGTVNNWYHGETQQGVHIQVKEGLAQLFDRQPELNNLMGSAITSAAFLDSDKIKTIMQNPTSELHTELFSKGQLREVLDAVSDRGERMMGNNADRQFLFQTGDSITAVVKVVDGDSDDTNSDRWLVTLQHQPPASEADKKSYTVSKIISEFIGSDWAQKGLDIDGETVSDNSGRVSLSANGSIVAIGARYNDGGGDNSGHVRIYEFDETEGWKQKGADIDGEASGDRSGFSVSLSANGSIVAIGAYFNDGGGDNSGHVRIYEFNDTNWVQKGTDIDGEAASDLSGYSVSLSADGSIVAIGAPDNDGNGDDSGHVRIYELGTGGGYKLIINDTPNEPVSDYSTLDNKTVSFNNIDYTSLVIDDLITFKDTNQNSLIVDAGTSLFIPTM